MKYCNIFVSNYSQSIYAKIFTFLSILIHAKKKHFKLK